jgi:maleate isomerase
MMNPTRIANYGTRLRIGLLIPSRNTICEPDAAAIVPDGVSTHIMRMPTLGTTQDALMAQAPELGRSAQMLASAKLDIIGFHCTAASTVAPTVGRDLAARLRDATGVAAVSTSEALLAALAAFGARRIVLATPYTRAVNEHEIEFFAAHGIEVVDHVWLGHSDAQGMSSVEPQEWIARTEALRRDGADACVLSCANIRVAPILAELERRLDLPVISSNQAMLWHCLRSAGFGEPVVGYGKLLTQH